jgi:phosphoadenosine phosphosulfate reductase
VWACDPTDIRQAQFGFQQPATGNQLVAGFLFSAAFFTQCSLGAVVSTSGMTVNELHGSQRDRMYRSESENQMETDAMKDLLWEIELRQDQAERSSAEQLLHWASERFGSRMAIASSFGGDAVVLIDIAARTVKNLRVFTLDTDFLFPETYELIERVQNKYGIQVERTHPSLSPREQAARYGEALWSREPNLCCQIRKVDPLKAKVVELDAWVSGIRRDQTSARGQARKLEWDAHFGLVKLNPLADWTSAQIWDYIREHHLPYNILYDRNYTSVGCAQCTRPIQIGEDPRAGRWTGFEKTECGLHARE